MTRRERILSLGSKLRVQRKLQEKLETRVEQRIEFRGLIGDHDGNIWPDADVPREIYVRRDGRTVIEGVLNIRCSNIYDMPVLVGYSNEIPHRLQVLSIDGGALGWSLGTIGLTEDHHQQHEFRKDGSGGNDIVWIAKQQIVDGLVYPPSTSGLQVNVHKFWYPVANTRRFMESQTDILNTELTNAEATLGSGEAMFVGIYLDTTTDPDEFATVNGTVFPQVLFPPEGEDSFPDFPTGSIPLAALYLEEGDGAVTFEDIYDVRDFPGGSGYGVVSPTQHELLYDDAHSDVGGDYDPVQGDIIVADGTPEWGKLAVGAVDTVLKSDGTDPAWGNVGHDELTDIAADDHHDPVTLHADLDSNLLALSTQELDLDTQAANAVLAGPSSGADAKPAFRALTTDDLPSSVGSHELLFAQVVDVTLANDTSETTILGAGRGTKTVTADTLDVGSAIRITASGYLSTTGTPTLDVDVDLGGTEVATMGAITTATMSSVGWRLEIEITCRVTGASGEVVASGTFEYGDGNQHDLLKTSATTVDTTGDLSIDIAGQWGTADAGNTITCQEATIELLKADRLAVAAPSNLTATEA